DDVVHQTEVEIAHGDVEFEGPQLCRYGDNAWMGHGTAPIALPKRHAISASIVSSSAAMRYVSPSSNSISRSRSSRNSSNSSSVVVSGSIGFITQHPSVLGVSGEGRARGRATR